MNTNNREFSVLSSEGRSEAQRFSWVSMTHCFLQASVVFKTCIFKKIKVWESLGRQTL